VGLKVNVAFAMNLAGNSTEPTIRGVDHAAVLQRLAQALDRVSTELRELVEEQHPVVQQGSIMYLEECTYFVTRWPAPNR
jgi:hypothetical protein